MRLVARDDFREAELESRWEAGPALVLVIGLQLLLAIVSQQKGWRQWGLPWWTWLVAIGPELVLLIPFAWQRQRRRLDQLGLRRMVAMAFLAVVTAANALSLVALIGSLTSGQEKSGGALLLKASAIWATNVIVFGLWFWELDRGGPVRRCQPTPPPPDFQFPQSENPQLAEPDWQPHLLDYVYIAFTNAIAFSPTDAMPLTRRTKLLMLIESAVSALTVLLAAARAVNILK
jgi:uncharacterized membrane protein